MSAPAAILVVVLPRQYRHLISLIAVLVLLQHLNSLLSIYLEPMKSANFLSATDTATLFGNITEIVNFQREFLSALDESVAAEGKQFDKFEQPGLFKATLFSLGNAFLSYADKFKLYSSFCASHSKAQKILHPSNEGNIGAFLSFE